MRTIGDFALVTGEVATFTLTWAPSFKPYPGRLDADAAMAAAARGWEESRTAWPVSDG